MMPPVHDAHAGRVRAAVGVALAATSLGLVVWFTCRPAGADHLTTNDPQERVLEAASPRSSVVVSVLRSEPRLADPGTPISDAEWSRHHAAARVQVAPELGRTLLARSIPPEGELQLDSAPSGTDAPIGNVTHVENGSLRVIDGWTNGSEDLQIELRLTLPLLGAPQVEVGAIAGTVRESGTRAPLRDAVVSLPSARLMTRTDTAGRYLLAPVPAGTSQVFVRRIGYAPGQFLAIVAVGDTVDVMMFDGMI